MRRRIFMDTQTFLNLSPKNGPLASLVRRDEDHHARILLLRGGWLFPTLCAVPRSLPPASIGSSLLLSNAVLFASEFMPGEGEEKQHY